MKRKEVLRRLASIIVVGGIIFSSIPVSAGQLPESIIRDGKVFMMDRTAGGGSGAAAPDNNMNSETNFNMGRKSSYRVTGSDVRLYVDYSHGHGGDHFAGGWVEATAPRFTVRVEVWSNGRLDTTGTNNLNKGNIARGSSYLACGIVKNATPRIFYSFL